MNAATSWATATSLVALAIPTMLSLFGLAAPMRAGGGALGALTAALLFVVGVAFGAAPEGSAGQGLGVRLDAATCVMLVLVCSLGAVVVRYSRTYLHGDPGLARYLRWLLLTLGAVTGLVIADNLLIVTLGWTATSLALHQLLTYFPERSAAIVAAHKKQIVSRLADVCLIASLALVHADVGSFELDQIACWVEAQAELPLSMEVAAVLVVNAVALRSAQLPFHGWLMQVMEAPTPVSALLHAGVVNIGGFVLLRLAPLLAHARVAPLLLVAIGLFSAVVAALVMTTRVSIKVALAWSTCAQMGLMLVQCGLGLWQLALLHLVAHSLYKAHAFLSAGSAVDEWRLRASASPPAPPSPARLVVTALLSVGLALLGVLALRRVFPLSPPEGRSDLVLALLVGLSMLPLLRTATPSSAPLVTAIGGRIAGVALLYVGWHGVAAQLVPMQPSLHPTANLVGWSLAAAAFIGLFAIKTALSLQPSGGLARAMHPWLFSGLYLDERFTSLAFRVWPPRLRPSAEGPGVIEAIKRIEVGA